MNTCNDTSPEPVENWPDLPEIIVKLVKRGLVMIDVHGKWRLTDDGRTVLADFALLDALERPATN